MSTTEREMAQLLRDADEFLTDTREIPDYVDDPVHTWALRARALYKPILSPSTRKAAPRRRRGARRSRR